MDLTSTSPRVVAVAQYGFAHNRVLLLAATAGTDNDPRPQISRRRSRATLLIHWALSYESRIGASRGRLVSATRRSSGVVPRACVRVYARVLVPPNMCIHTYILYSLGFIIRIAYRCKPLHRSTSAHISQHTTTKPTRLLHKHRGSRLTLHQRRRRPCRRPSRHGHHRCPHRQTDPPKRQVTAAIY